jgi:hypothetical protein
MGKQQHYEVQASSSRFCDFEEGPCSRRLWRPTLKVGEVVELRDDVEKAQII